MVRSMMKAKGMPTRFWGEAVTSAVFILYRAPNKPLKGKTLFEAWYEHKPSVSFLRTFGCIGHVRKTKPVLTKLADRSTPMVLLAMRMVPRRTGSMTHAEARWLSRAMLCSTRRWPGIGRLWARGKLVASAAPSLSST